MGGLGLIAGLLVLAAVGITLVLWRNGKDEQRSFDGLTYRVQPMELSVTALETGTLESASSIPVFSEVEQSVAIISLVPEGTRVEAGDVVVELESGGLRTRRTEQQILVEKARAALSQAQQRNIVAGSQSESDVQAAQLALEFAELDLRKYLEGDYPLELRAIRNESALAEEELERARSPLGVLEELHKDGYLNDSKLEAERFRAVRAQYQVEIAEERARVLQEYAYPRQKRLLESKVVEAERALERVNNLAKAAVQQAETHFAAEEAALRLEESKLEHLEDQIAKCTLHAPQAGVVVYPFPEDNDMVELIIKQGTLIRERQHVFSIPDTDVLQVTTSVHEALVNQIKPGMPARIEISVFPDLVLRGEVKHVSPLPEPQDWRRTTVKFYSTKVSLLEQAEGLRPGMTARVEILIERLADALALPVQSVVQRGKVGFCYVLEDGEPVLRKLVLGKASVEHIAVLEGLSAGEVVLLSPDEIGFPANAFEKEAAAADVPAPEAGETVEETPVAPAGDEPEPEGPVEEIEFKAVMVGSGTLMAEAEFEIQNRAGVELKREFEVEVKGGAPDAVLEVAVDGVVIGSVTLDATGYGVGEWNSKKGTLPPEFPAATSAGSRVTIGPELAGTLAP
jgi:HlyD family secretion protein